MDFHLFNSNIAAVVTILDCLRREAMEGNDCTRSVIPSCIVIKNLLIDCIQTADEKNEAKASLIE